jgi:hypothetical protein
MKETTHYNLLSKLIIAYLGSEAVGKPAVQTQFQHFEGEERDLPRQVHWIGYNLQRLQNTLLYVRSW